MASPLTSSAGSSDIQAAAFDFDGTLVDTMPLHFEAYRRAFDEAGGVALDRELFDAAIGGKAGEVVPRLLGHYGLTTDPLVLHARKKAILHELLETLDIPVLEVAKLLPLLRPHLAMGLVTSGSREGIELMLAKLDWLPYFDVVVTGDDVACGKPAPEPYLAAAGALDVAADRCIAFEDTEAGLDSARSAGMVVFDVRAMAGLP